MILLAEAHNWWWWTKHSIGIENASGATYLFWSGFVGDLALFAAVFAFMRHKNCHVKGCWRLGHADPSHGHPTCRIHSPHFDARGRPRSHDRLAEAREVFERGIVKPQFPKPEMQEIGKPPAPPADPSNHGG